MLQLNIENYYSPLEFLTKTKDAKASPQYYKRRKALTKKKVPLGPTQELLNQLKRRKKNNSAIVFVNGIDFFTLHPLAFPFSIHFRSIETKDA